MDIERAVGPPEIGSVRPRAIGREARAFGGISARSVSLGGGGGEGGAQVWVRLGAWIARVLLVFSSVSCNGFIVCNLFHFSFESRHAGWWDEDIEVRVQLCQYALSGALLLD